MKPSAQRESCESSTQHSVAQSSEYPLQLSFVGATEWVGAAERCLANGLRAVVISPAKACPFTGVCARDHSVLIMCIVAKVLNVAVSSMHAANLNIRQARRESECLCKVNPLTCAVGPRGLSRSSYARDWGSSHASHINGVPARSVQPVLAQASALRSGDPERLVHRHCDLRRSRSLDRWRVDVCYDLEEYGTACRPGGTGVVRSQRAG